MIPRPDLLDTQSPAGISVWQLTDDPAVPAAHIYMEAQVFTPDSQHLLINTHAHAHGRQRGDDYHRQFFRCDLDDQASLHPLLTEPNAIAPSVSPDGRYVYYFVDNTDIGCGQLHLKRVNLDGTDRTTLLTLETLPGTAGRPSLLYALSTISSDGQSLAASVYLGDGSTDAQPCGILVFDLHKALVDLILDGPEWTNTHPQYCRSTHPSACGDLMIQHNHASFLTADGFLSRPADPLGVDIHVIADDGSNLRSLPFGRDGSEFCQGHQCWRGDTPWAITSTQTYLPDRDHAEAMECRLIEGLPTADTDHLGSTVRSGMRNELSSGFANPQFHHFATDAAGDRLISDYWVGTQDSAGRMTYTAEHLVLLDLAEPGTAPANRITYLLNTNTGISKQTQSHPFLSPDGKTAFFNSDESGTLQAYMITGLEAL